MKKTYTAPTAEAIDLTLEAPILAGTTGMGDQVRPGADSEEDVLSSKTIWNYNDSNEK